MPELSYQKALLPACRTAAALLAVTGLLAACEGESPRSYSEYLEDPIAREATLLRCNAGREASRGDAECINAKRAAAALAAHDDADKRRRFEAESQRKRAALRERIAARQAAEQRQQAELQRRANAAYEQSWSYSDNGQVGEYPGADGLSPERHQDVYSGQQFPAQPLQPGVSDPSEENASGAVSNYMSGQVEPGYSLSNGGGAITTPEVVEAPVRPLPDATPAPAASSVPDVENEVIQEPPQVTEDSSAADPSWQPFEPPAAGQPGEG